MLRNAAALVLLLAFEATAENVSGLLGDTARTARGEEIGRISELIVDVRAGRVLYVVVEAQKEFVTLPVRALGERQIVDMALADETAHLRPQAEPRFRRAGKLLGQPVAYPGGKNIGTLVDIQFELGSGRVEDVVVRTEKGPFNFPPAVLAEGYFPAYALGLRISDEGGARRARVRASRPVRRAQAAA